MGIMSGGSRAGQIEVEIHLEGAAALMRELDEIAAIDGRKSVNRAMASLAKEAAREIVLPDARAAVPTDSGFLESQIKVKAIKRSRSKVGSTIGYKDPLFTGDTFYGGFHEFKWRDRGGNVHEGDKYLRRALYTNTNRVRKKYSAGLRKWVKLRNSVAVTG